MALSDSQKLLLERHIRSSCPDPTCRGFLEQFGEYVGDGRLGAFLKSELGLANPTAVLDGTFQGIQVLRFDQIDSVCIASAVEEILNRISRRWPE